MRLLLLSLSIVSLCCALYEDQVGKFDWRKQFVGCPRQVFFHKADKGEQLIVSTQEHLIASISTANGELNWRRIQEDNLKSTVQVLKAGTKRIYTVSDGGKTLRSWNVNTGAVLWQKTLCTSNSSTAETIALEEGSHGIYVYACETLFYISTSGEEIWKVHGGKAEWVRLALANNEVRLILLEQEKVIVKTVVDGKITNTGTLDIKANPAKCSFTGKYVVCFHSEDIVSVDVTTLPLISDTHKTGLNIRQIVALDAKRVAVRSPAATVILRLAPLKEMFKINKSVDTITLADQHIIAVSDGYVFVLDASSGENVFSAFHHDRKAVSTTHIFANSLKDSLSLLTIYNDCRTDFTVINLHSKNLEVEWVREEGLARVASVEMVDLPLSESQQLIEDEFEDKRGNIFSAFLHRAISQIIQVQRWLVHSIHKAVSITESMTSKESFSQLLNSVKATSRPSNSGPLERDYFNLRKMVVLASLDGVIFGIDSSDGTLLWRTNLGKEFSPLKNSLGEDKIPLYIQRSTSNYHLNGQAVVVFKDSVSGHGIILVFDPITGVPIERKSLEHAINRVDLLPYAGKEQIHSLVIIDANEKVSFYPELSIDFDYSHPIFVLTFTSSQLGGKRVNFKTRRVETIWNANIHLTPDEKIVAVKGKPAHQRVHSQGRVLIDRNVQYKYSNPNLVAIAVLDSTNYVLTIYIVDSVSGLIVHTSKLPRASGPIHMVHCENWVAYSYWSEKSRRTEIGIIELFEGDVQSNPEKFDSLLPTSKAPEVTSQSYVYAQGVEAMAVSETEQGLTTRSIILALPFGGLHEVSRKLLDANRPHELTQEMREEGYIPYMPELPIATEEMVNYNQTIFKVKGIKTSSSGLESTSLMLAYGVDLFFTRLHPSGTFDILKDDFDHVLISLVLVGLFAGSFISKRIARNNALKASWA